MIHIKKDSSIYILDEPTTGLHPKEVEMLVSIMRRLIKQGGSVLVIEHNLDLIKEADYVIELGPGGGKKGGKLMFQGPTHLLCQERRCATAPYLKPYFFHYFHYFTKNKPASGCFWAISPTAHAVDQRLIASKIRLLLVGRISSFFDKMLRKKFLLIFALTAIAV